ncbi:MAG TPA: hypothetical protein VHB20_08680 [Verrucomicrobiae bacterium]|jgi:hypothetical protein|nr:hypothetical protein [Verrucomicrobiae bacterium]
MNNAFPTINATACAERLFGPVDWQDAANGYCQCPGLSHHTGPNKREDCKIFLNGVPTVYCMHTSCLPDIEAANRQFRSALRKGAARLPDGALNAPRNGMRNIIEREKATIQRLRLRAKNSLAQILSEFASDPAELFEQSPIRLTESAKKDWRLLLQLFAPDDVIWIGAVTDSGPGREGNFRPVSDWMQVATAPALFTCPSTFKPGSFSRSKDNVLARPFLVVESDTLPKEQICAVFSWLRQFLKMRAVVDTAGKSLHGWFEFPHGRGMERELKEILPQLGCDPALFKPTQPCRLPGAPRPGKGGRLQSLYFLDTLGGGDNE